MRNVLRVFYLVDLSICVQNLKDGLKLVCYWENNHFISHIFTLRVYMEVVGLALLSTVQIILFFCDWVDMDKFSSSIWYCLPLEILEP